VVLGLLERARKRRAAVRLLGVRLSNLEPADEQLSLFDQDERLHRAVDQVRTCCGYDVLRVALADRRRDD